MNSEEEKNVMWLLRFPIWRMYGRVALKLSGYWIMNEDRCFPYGSSDYGYYMPKNLWVEVVSSTGRYFKAKIENGQITLLAEKRLNV